MGSENNSINIIHSRNVMYNPKKKKKSVGDGARSLNTDKLERTQENSSAKHYTSTNAQSSRFKLPKIGVNDSRLQLETNDSGSPQHINSPVAARSYIREGSVLYTPHQGAADLRTPKPDTILRNGSVEGQYSMLSPIKRGPLAYSKSGIKRRGTVL
jgi:hypothetical protein